VNARLPDRYFTDMYAKASDPWQLSERWYEQRKYALTVAMLPQPEYRHAFEPGCSVGVLTEHLTRRCAHVTATDVAAAALDAARARLRRAAQLDRVTLLRRSLDSDWPAADFDLIVLSEVAYYLSAPALRAVLDRECRRLRAGTTIIASHWRHRVEDYPLSGDEANAAIAETDDVNELAAYDDVAIAVFVKGPAQSVATRSEVPGARPRRREAGGADSASVD
jgi:cyclopropane fatty-acyl-phospholipid synthase-like methyltransferase